jgi:hypothetical protein
MSCDPYLPSDHAFAMFLGTVELDQVRLEEASHFADVEWHALARDRRNR